MAGESRNHLSDLAEALSPVRHLKVVGRLVRPARKQAGTPPGTIIHTGREPAEAVRISVVDFDGEQLREWEAESPADCFHLRDTGSVSWINVDGVHDVEMIRDLGEHFGLHPLVLEDVANVGQRPKVEEYEDYLYLVLHMLTFDELTGRASQEQISLVVGANFVLSFQERVGDVFEPVRGRLRNGLGRIRSSGTDYLAYALVDAVVDEYYAVLEKLGELVEEIDEEVLEGPGRGVMHRIHELKREMLVVRRSIWPVRDVAAQLLRGGHPRIGEETRVYFRDVYDHSVQIMDTVETLRDLSSGLTDLHLSAMGHRQNEVMKVLTVMASIFIPLTFLAGIYGMNFEYMPELGIPWAYPALIGVMALLSAGMVWYFRRKGWI